MNGHRIRHYNEDIYKPNGKIKKSMESAGGGAIREGFSLKLIEWVAFGTRSWEDAQHMKEMEMWESGNH